MTDRLQQTINLLKDMPEDVANGVLNMIEPLINLRKRASIATTNQEIRFLKLMEIGQLTKGIAGKFSYAIIVNAESGIYAVDPEDTVVGYSLRHSGNYGKDEVERIEKLVTINSNVLILGAHIGTLAIPLAKIVKHVTAIEANPNTFQLLELNLALNDLENCRAINIAASDKKGTIKFLLNKTNSGGSKRKPLHDQFMYHYDDPQEILMSTEALDTLLPDEVHDLIIMDLEGSEYFALKGMTSTLRKAKVLIIEFVPHHLKNISGITVEIFWNLLSDFKYMTVPSLGIKVTYEDSLTVLQNMYNDDSADDGLIFEK